MNIADGESLRGLHAVMKSPEVYFVYVLRSSKDGGLYTGMTDDLERRLGEHNSGKSKSTRHRRPFTLVYSEQFSTRAEAAKCERFLKSGAGHKFLKNILPQFFAPAEQSAQSSTPLDSRKQK